MQLSKPLIAALSLLSFSQAGFCNDFEYILSLSLEELTQVSINPPGSITNISLQEAPAKFTVISANDIRLSPSRNIYDLLETYVPGAFWMGHEEGPHPGIRGLISSRNNQFLLRVNGRVLNSKAQYGAKSELEQWNLDDIQRIEVIRGAGSVTYGPGAIAGVINIYTHTADSFTGQQVSVRHITEYNSSSVSYNYGSSPDDNIKTYGHISITRTKGSQSSQFLVTNNNEAGFIGEDILLNDIPMDYYADYQDEPQVKLHLDTELSENSRLWLRYTQQGSTWRGNEVKTEFNGELLNQQGTRDRQLTIAYEYKNSINSTLAFNSMASIDSYDAERRRDNVKHPDPDHVLNFLRNFSENELFLSGQFNWQATEETEIAFGAEFSRDHFGTGWNDDAQDMRLGDDSNIVNGPDSNVIDPEGIDLDEAIFVGDGWYTNTVSLFAESNTQISNANRLIISARADQNSYSDILFSPRLALITTFENNDILKTIISRSQRMNTAGQLYIENEFGMPEGEETLDSFEIAYSGDIGSNYYFELGSFYNDIEIIDWDGDINASTPVGDLQVAGIETAVNYKLKDGSIGISYTFSKQLDWNLEEDLTSSSVSYSDYNQPLRNTNATMLGTGNDLNNWPNHALKFISRYHFSNSTSLHLDAHVFWDFQGAQDGLSSLENAVNGEPEEAAVAQSLQRVNDEEAYQTDFRLNASISHKPSKNLELLFYAQNLLSNNENKRYSYDSGNDRATPRRVRFVEEPSTFGIRIDYQF